MEFMCVAVPLIHPCIIVQVCIYVCMYVRMYMWTKKRAVWGLTTRKSSVSVIYCSLVKFNGQKGAYYARRFALRKKIGAILLTGWKKGPRKLYYGLKPCLVYTHAICSYAMLTNAERKHTTTAVQTYNIATGAVCTDSA